MIDKLEACSKVIELANDIIYHDVYLINKIELFGEELSKFSEDALGNLFNNGNTLVNSSVVVRKTALVAIDGITEERSCITWEDYDTWLRLAEKNIHLKKRLRFLLDWGGNISNPQQEIKNIESFILKYLPDRRNSIIPWWCHYEKGINYLKN